MEQGYDMLFSPYTLGSIILKNRIVMAPMTRNRAIGNVPNEMMARYYADRATAGLIITEGTAPASNGLGYARIPGIFTDEQVNGWLAVTEAVHAKGGKIFLQLMHTGRISHGLNLPGVNAVAPSAIAATGEMWTDTKGLQPLPVPMEIPIEDVPVVVAQYVESSISAIAAGFDGVEIHAANGYLPMQFLNPASNHRTDGYGGSHENRNRFVLDLAAAMAGAIGKDKVGIRLSPFNPFNSMTPDDDEQMQYLALVDGLKNIGLCYMHLLCFAIPPAFLGELRAAFGGTVMLNGGYTAARAEADLEAGKGDLISFARPYISNPDFAERIKNDAPLAEADAATFYTPGEHGYNDYARA